MVTQIMTIPNLITGIRNAIKSNKHKITIKASKNVLNFSEVLLKNQYILGYSLVGDNKVHIFMNFTYKKNRILALKHVSKPSINIYFSHQDLWKFDRTLGHIILNTSKGIICHKTALSECVGGQILCYIL